jgi:hypothetical protein
VVIIVIIIGFQQMMSWVVGGIVPTTTQQLLLLLVQYLKVAVWDHHQCCQALAGVQQEGKMEATDLHMTFWGLVELVEWLVLLEVWDGHCLNETWLVSHH